jgi:hypothetical protein
MLIEEDEVCCCTSSGEQHIHSLRRLLFNDFDTLSMEGVHQHDDDLLRCGVFVLETANHTNQFSVFSLVWQCLVAPNVVCTIQQF